MLTLYVIQFGLPLALIIMLIALPSRSVVGLSLQSVASVASIVAVSFLGIWTFPPWWTPYALLVLCGGLSIDRLMRRRPMAVWPHGMIAWLIFTGFAGLGFYAIDEIRRGYNATRQPGGPIIQLASPLGPGSYLVANGGTGTDVNAHRAYWAIGHGVDIIALDAWGLRADGIMPADPRRYLIFERPVLAPCSGTVVASVDGLPDMMVPKVDHAHLAGNHVVLRCANADILLGHFRKGSLRAGTGQRLRTGELIAAVGNSGNTSEPHLHINAQKPGTAALPYSGAPMPIRIDGRYLVRNSRFVVPIPRRRP